MSMNALKRQVNLGDDRDGQGRVLHGQLDRVYRGHKVVFTNAFALSESPSLVASREFALYGHGSGGLPIRST